MRAALGAVTAVLLGAGVFTACSTTPPEGEALCSALDGGMVPGVALGALPVAATDPNAAVARARDLVRSTCPQHEEAAVAYDRYLTPPPVAVPAVAPPPPAPTTTVASPTSRTSRPRATTTPQRPITRGPADAASDTIKSCMVRTGQTENQCRRANGMASSDVAGSAAAGGGLAACMEATGRTEAQCKAASARGEGG